MAVVMKNAIRAVVPDPKTCADTDAQSAYQISRLVRNAFAHAPFAPLWSIDSNCRDKVFTVGNIITLDTSGLHGTAFDWRHYGGPLALFRLCRFVRTEILKDKPPEREIGPVSDNVIYQQGGLILTTRKA